MWLAQIILIYLKLITEATGKADEERWTHSKNNSSYHFSLIVEEVQLLVYTIYLASNQLKG